MSFYVKPEYAGNAYRASERTPENAYPRKSLQERGLRSYSPNLSRWLSRDPIGEMGGINVYSFVANVVPSHIDPRGLSIFEFCAKDPETGSWICEGGTIEEDPRPPRRPKRTFGLPSINLSATVAGTGTACFPSGPGGIKVQMSIGISSGLCCPEHCQELKNFTKTKASFTVSWYTGFCSPSFKPSAKLTGQLEPRCPKSDKGTWGYHITLGVTVGAVSGSCSYNGSAWSCGAQLTPSKLSWEATISAGGGVDYTYAKVW